MSLYVWPADDLTAAARRSYTGADIGNFRFSQDRLAITLAVVPAGHRGAAARRASPELDQLDRRPRRHVIHGTTTTHGRPAATDTTAASTSTTAAGAQ